MTANADQWGSSDNQDKMGPNTKCQKNSHTHILTYMDGQGS